MHENEAVCDQMLTGLKGKGEEELLKYHG